MTRVVKLRRAAAGDLPSRGPASVTTAALDVIVAGAVAGDTARLTRAPGGHRVVVVGALEWYELRAATSRLEAATGMRPVMSGDDDDGELEGTDA